QRRLTGLRLHFFGDAPAGGCRPPDDFRIEYGPPDRDPGLVFVPTAVIPTRRSPERPAQGENVVEFEAIEAGYVRITFRNAGQDFYTGLHGFEPIFAPDEKPEAASSPLVIDAEKFITPDDVLVTVLRVHNRGDREQGVVVDPILPWMGFYSFFGSRIEPPREAPFPGLEPRTLGSKSLPMKLHGQDVEARFRYAVVDEPARPVTIVVDGAMSGALKPGTFDGFAQGLHVPDLGFTHRLAPGATKVFKAAFQVARPDEGEAPLDAVVRPVGLGIKPEHINHTIVRQFAAGEQDTRDPLAEQVRAYQSWFDANLAYFDCSDPWVRKMYYHRAYNLRKNMLDPRLGRMKWPTQSEGRWRSPWYPNVISYGAGHQVREARWLRDPKFWQGHLRTWAENEKPDGVYPSHVTPAGPAGGQYTDWITSTAWDGSLVHPDKDFLAQVVDKLAANVRGWQTVYDPDGDGLLLVDDHWWTGMEWQPSFFHDSDYKTDPKDTGRPARRVRLERVDLTAYNYGNAVAVARIYRLLDRPEKAQEFEELAGKIARAVAAKMWDPRGQFFLSLRFDDKAPIPDKEIIGVYPFYFGMLPRGQGFEAAWASILDPEQFWTPWPVASASKRSPAYAQEGWPTEPGRGTGCMWNGPTWPHANSIVMTAMARTIRADREAGQSSSPLTTGHLWELFSSFTRAQYRDQDMTYPWTGEFYNGETARWKTAERDYNHSTWLDVLIPELLGLVPRADDVLEVDPLVPEAKLTHFLLDGQHYHGHDVTIAWDAPDGDDHYGDGRQGLDVYLDGRRVASAPGLSRLVIDLKSGRPPARGPSAR
ncbi:MAG TPA: hypothetical protein VF590_15380, partial [Isosphaeraceae bacterium]